LKINGNSTTESANLIIHILVPRAGRKIESLAIRFCTGQDILSERRWKQCCFNLLVRVSGRFCPRINCRAKRGHKACNRAYALVVDECATCCSGGCVHDLVWYGKRADHLCHIAFDPPDYVPQYDHGHRVCGLADSRDGRWSRKVL